MILRVILMACAVVTSAVVAGLLASLAAMLLLGVV
jgi:hypothetical protein